jgi:choice-of-anchor C domain-containing protein
MSQTAKPIFAVVVALSVLISGVAFIESVSAQQPNLVQNGSFENSSNNFGSDETNNKLDAGSTTIDGWRVSSGEVDQVGNFWPPQDGSVSIDLSGGEPGAIEQDVTELEAEKHYELTYYYKNNTEYTGKHEARVEIADLNITETANSSMDWTLATHNFTAGNTTETLKFTQITPTSGRAGMVIDNVSIVESSHNRAEREYRSASGRCDAHHEQRFAQRQRQ